MVEAAATRAQVRECAHHLVRLGFRVVTGSSGSWTDADIWLDPLTSMYAALSPEGEQFMDTLELIKDWDEREQEEAWRWAMDKAREIVLAVGPLPASIDNSLT